MFAGNTTEICSNWHRINYFRAGNLIKYIPLVTLVCMLVQANRAKVIFAKKPSQKKANKVHGCIAGKFFRKRSDIVTVTQPSLKRKKKKKLFKTWSSGSRSYQCQMSIHNFRSRLVMSLLFTRYSSFFNHTMLHWQVSTQVNEGECVLSCFDEFFLAQVALWSGIGSCRRKLALAAKTRQTIEGKKVSQGGRSSLIETCEQRSRALRYHDWRESALYSWVASRKFRRKKERAGRGWE